MFYAEYDARLGWRMKFEIAGGVYPVDICGAANEMVARETAAEMNAYRARHP